MPFFSPATEADDAGSPITKDSDHGLAWTEAGEAIGVPKTPRFSHPQSVPDFRAPARVLSPSEKPRFSNRFYPLSLEKTHNEKIVRTLFYWVKENCLEELILVHGISLRIANLCGDWFQNPGCVQCCKMARFNPNAQIRFN
jgi:hypothetical protein